eukprot:6262157-Amphidinium_carterae.1
MAHSCPDRTELSQILLDELVNGSLMDGLLPSARLSRWHDKHRNCKRAGHAEAHAQPACGDCQPLLQKFSRKNFQHVAESPTGMSRQGMTCYLHKPLSSFPAHAPTVVRNLSPCLAAPYRGHRVLRQRLFLLRAKKRSEAMSATIESSSRCGLL